MGHLVFPELRGLRGHRERRRADLHWESAEPVKVRWPCPLVVSPTQGTGARILTESRQASPRRAVQDGVESRAGTVRLRWLARLRRWLDRYHRPCALPSHPARRRPYRPKVGLERPSDSRPSRSDSADPTTALLTLHRPRHLSSRERGRQPQYRSARTACESDDQAGGGVPEEDQAVASGGIWSEQPGEYGPLEPLGDAETEAQGSGRAIRGTGSAARGYRRSPPGHADFGR